MVSETPAAGSVCIVGAGPGPADLMTLRALNRLKQAQVVVHDRLIAEDVLALIPAARSWRRPTAWARPTIPGLQSAIVTGPEGGDAAGVDQDSWRR